MDGVTGALIAFPIEKVLNKLFGVAQIIFSSKSEGKELKKKLSSLKAAIDEISKEISKKISDSDSLSDRVKQYKDFQAELNDGLRLVDKIEKIHGFDLFRKYRYGKKVLDFHKKIKDFIDIHGSPDVVHDVQNLTAVVEGLERRISDDWEKLSATMRDLERLIREDVIPRLNSNPISNTLFLQQINTSQTYIDMMNEPADAPQSVFCTFQVPAMPKFVVGLDNHIDDVRQNLLQDDVNIVGVTGMGGSGKTTLALALCNDLKVHASFHDIIFITVSNLDENTNGILDILKTMWDKIVRGPKPNFRGIEDARYQLQENLKLRTNWRTLVILDDVWSKSNAEQLLFEAKGYKTIVTTREESTVPAKSSSRLYKMSVLEEANALSLFCFWAFDSKYSIPTTEREDLVKQVAAQCGGLPLALKVIGSCLRGQPRPVWESAKDDLSRAEYRKRYHKDALLDRLEMSINTLDDESAKAVFFGLGGISPRWKVLCGFVIRHLGICPRNEMGVCLCGFVRACKSKSDRSHRRFQGRAHHIQLCL